MTDATLSLSLISEHRILDKAAGLNEPSGLTLNHDGSALYTPSVMTPRRCSVWI